jgi:hypothetical protein
MKKVERVCLFLSFMAQRFKNLWKNKFKFYAC